MPRNTVPERVARLEEFRKQTEKAFDNFNRKLEIINREQGETRDAMHQIGSEVKSLKKLVNNKVAAPMTGRDRAVLYGTTITSICSLIGTVVIAVAQLL